MAQHLQPPPQQQMPSPLPPISSGKPLDVSRDQMSGLGYPDEGGRRLARPPPSSQAPMSPPQSSRRPPPPPPESPPMRSKWRSSEPPLSAPLLGPPVPQHPVPPASDIRGQTTSPGAYHFDRGTVHHMDSDRAPPVLPRRLHPEPSMHRGRPVSPPMPTLGRAADGTSYQRRAPPDDSSPPFESLGLSGLSATAQQQSYTTSGVKAALAQLLEAQGFRVKKPGSHSGTPVKAVNSSAS